ncbi:FMN-binding negative transcriptional regulator [Chryseosolibacter indicus]|uniref:FMN-binding negative transcriptional regulator n=1 Tax=Chryseosolibacter indicus TaxID=2782351 RepID=A0ABS5VVQ1_9BACT|nr:FMN-binding negative transcriptional regulator [Chryseosolibacter indicus]MBT1705513.1 FMN-binding negative transcriptional regulator [Chryseosolibacter indicus]
MYTPKIFNNTNTEEVKTFIRKNSFGILVSQVNNKLWATHIPLELTEDDIFLEGHISKANPQWRNFNAGDEVMAIFQGAHTYISSSWYDHENVPTWNYMAVHVYGTVEIIEGEQLMNSLRRIVDKYEQRSVHPVSMAKMSPEFLQREIRGIVGFQIRITNIEATYKLSQNRDAVNHKAIISELEKREDENSHAIAGAMSSAKK